MRPYVHHGITYRYPEATKRSPASRVDARVRLCTEHNYGEIVIYRRNKVRINGSSNSLQRRGLLALEPGRRGKIRVWLYRQKGNRPQQRRQRYVSKAVPFTVGRTGTKYLELLHKQRPRRAHFLRTRTRQRTSHASPPARPGLLKRPPHPGTFILGPSMHVTVSRGKPWHCETSRKDTQNGRKTLLNNLLSWVLTGSSDQCSKPRRHREPPSPPRLLVLVNYPPSRHPNSLWTVTHESYSHFLSRPSPYPHRHLHPHRRVRCVWRSAYVRLKQDIDDNRDMAKERRARARASSFCIFKGKK
ncbi:hypothetical protein LZ30DRAFT_450817 [Colletotrichum cereale]|nr:hypothetical protein LZ30DRAFT_450817 [Colletotrichum cereale]